MEEYLATFSNLDEHIVHAPNNFGCPNPFSKPRKSRVDKAHDAVKETV